jgi:hypothetical protein
VPRTITGTKRQAQVALAKLVTEVETGQVAKSHAGSVADLPDRSLDDISTTRTAYTMREPVKWGMVVSNAADRATPPGTTRSTVSAPSVKEVQRLISSAEALDPVPAAAIALGAVTGARRGELCALRWSDVDWDKRPLRIDRSLTVLDRVAKEGRTKTHSRRDISIDEALAAFVSRRQAEQRRYASQVGVALVEDPYLLSRSADGSVPCLPDGLTAGYSRLAQRARHQRSFPRLVPLRGAGGSATLTHRSRCGCTPTPLRPETGSWRDYWAPRSSGPCTAARSLTRLTRQRRPSWKAPGSSPRRAKS